ncbi:MAG: hypothetical protein ACJ744_04100 [Gaiellaceae bacterium]
MSAVEVGREAAKHGAEGRHVHRDRALTVVEAVVLSLVTLLAAWSGYAAAKWSTESRLKLAEASATHTKANRAFQESLTFRVGDATTFNAWFGAYLTGDKDAIRIAEKRFRPDYRAAFDAWMGTRPFTNPNAPPGPQSMPQYKPTGEAESRALDAKADALTSSGEHDGETGDDYVRTTVILASVLFLVGISSHFAIRPVRIGLLIFASVLLVLAAIAVTRLPVPP